MHALEDLVVKVQLDATAARDVEIRDQLWSLALAKSEPASLITSLSIAEALEALPIQVPLLR